MYLKFIYNRYGSCSRRSTHGAKIFSSSHKHLNGWGIVQLGSIYDSAVRPLWFII